MSERSITETNTTKTEWTDVFGDKHTNTKTEQKVNGRKTEAGKSGGK